MKKIIIALACIAIMGVATVPTAFAVQSLDNSFLPQGLPTLTGKTNEEALSANQSRVILTQRIVDVVLGTAGAVAAMFIVINGFYMITSAGNDEGVTKAKKGISWAIVGLLAIIFSYSVVTYVIKVTLLTDDPSADRSGVIDNGPLPNAPQDTSPAGNSTGEGADMSGAA